MESYMHLLQNSSLFAGISMEEIKNLCICLAAREKSVPREAFVFQAGDDVRFVYLILSGSMHIVDEDFWGNRSILETMGTYTLFGEAYIFASRKKQLVSVVAAEDAMVLEIDPTRLFETCACGYGCHAKLLRNALAILSEKIVWLTEKVDTLRGAALVKKFSPIYPNVRNGRIAAVLRFLTHVSSWRIISALTEAHYLMN